MDIRECTNLCWQCRDTCQNIFFNHCLKMGGKHVEESHARLMVDCMEICQAAADFMRRNSPLSSLVCNACAEICDACADSCEQIGDETMRACAVICRRCAEACRAMGSATLVKAA